MSTLTTATRHPFTPPYESRAFFISDAVFISFPSFKYRRMWLFMVAIRLSQMSFPDCGSLKSYRLIVTPTLFEIDGTLASGARNDNTLHYQTSKMPLLNLAVISLVEQGHARSSKRRRTSFEQSDQRCGQTS